MPVDFSVHDVADFPLVRFRPERVADGFSAAWAEEMDRLVGGSRFALLFPSLDIGENPEDYKARGLWLKGNQERLARSCVLLATVEPDDARRAELQAILDKARAGVRRPQILTRDLAEAEARCRHALEAAPAL